MLPYAASLRAGICGRRQSAAGSGASSLRARQDSRIQQLMQQDAGVSCSRLRLTSSARTLRSNSRSTSDSSFIAKATAPVQGDQARPQMKIITGTGEEFTVEITPGTTTVGVIRQAVAHRMGVQANLVRLAYYGNELQPANDSDVFVKRPDVDVMHAMKRDAPAVFAEPPKQEKLQVYTMEGKKFEMTVTPGVTTAGAIRKIMANATGAALSEVRLQYAGHELDPTRDSDVVNFKSSMFVMHSMKRMQGGSNSSTETTKAQALQVSYNHTHMEAEKGACGCNGCSCRDKFSVPSMSQP